MTVAVLALQGAFIEHEHVLEELGVKTVELRQAADLDQPYDGLILPGRFVPLFERNGFIVRFDEYIWEQTCKMLRLWLDKGYRPTPVSINVSRMHFNDDHFSGKLLALTDSTLAKLRAMTDTDFDALELYPDFDE